MESVHMLGGSHTLLPLLLLLLLRLHVAVVEME